MTSEKLENHLKRARVKNGKAWLPAVYSETDSELRAAIEEVLGSPESAGYMSEECGWRFEAAHIEDYVTPETVVAIFGEE